METMRGHACQQIREAVSAQTTGTVQADLAVATRYAYDASCVREAGNERVYASAALRVRDCTASALFAAPAPLTEHLVAAIVALMRDDLAAVPVRLQHARHVAAVTVQG